MQIWKVVYSLTGYSSASELAVFGLADSAEEAARKGESHVRAWCAKRHAEVLGRKIKKGEPEIYFFQIRSVNYVGEVKF